MEKQDMTTLHGGGVSENRSGRGFGAVLSRHPEKSNNQAICDCVDYDLFRIYQCLLKTQSKLIDSEYPKNHFSLMLKGFFRSFGMTYKRRAAFTLAEVLITLGVIGVVAAMTLPTLVQNYKEKATVTKLKKAYSILSNAYIRAQVDNSDISSWFTSNENPSADDIKEYTEVFVNNLKPYLSITKDCGFGTGCFQPGFIKTLDGRDLYKYDTVTNEYRFILSDGMAIDVYIAGSAYSSLASMPAEYEPYGNIKVDVDGLKGDYTYGKDVFQFLITKKAIIPYGGYTDMFGQKDMNESCNKNIDTASGTYCTAWVIQNENMDYLHCDDLSWNGKHKCK